MGKLEWVAAVPPSMRESTSTIPEAGEMPTESPAESHDLTAERWFPVPGDRVWTQCTTKGGLEAWWSPEDLLTRGTRLEARLGGRVEISLRYVPAMLGPKAEDAFRAAGVPISLRQRGTVRDFEIHRRLALELTLTLDKAGAGVTNVTRLEFESVTTGTRVRLSVAGKGDRHWVTLGKANLMILVEGNLLN